MTWHETAACGPSTAHLFFSDANSREAERICTRCPVQSRCRDHAMDNRIEHGVWGGLSPRDRKHRRWLHQTG